MSQTHSGPVFLNEIFLEHSHTHSFVYCLLLFMHHNAELPSCDTDPRASKCKIFNYLVLYKKSLSTFNVEDGLKEGKGW